MIEDEISKKVIGMSIQIHKTLGPGLLESAYRECLYFDLIQKRIICGERKANTNHL